MSKMNDSLGFLAGLVAGAAIGLVLSVAMAPRSGQETREQLLDASQNAASTVTGAPGALRDRVSQAIQDRTNIFQEAMLNAQEVAEMTERDLMEEYDQTLDETRQNS